jgi:hypothetical protein
MTGVGRWMVGAGMALLAACGGANAEDGSAAVTAGGERTVSDNTNATPPQYEAQPAQQEPAPARHGRSGSGRTAEDPVSACGPDDSYAFVAGEFQCPEGGNPLGGDPMTGARARVGNVGANSTGHIIDLYRVPCPSGEVEVYVDMYGCPEMGDLLGE